MKRAITILLVAAALISMLTVLAAGTQEDPLITKTYAEGAYRAEITELINSRLAGTSALMKRVNALETSAVYGYAPGFTQYTLEAGEDIVLIPGSSFTFTTGSATVAFSEGTVINVTTGERVSSGTALTQNNRYFCGENTTATITAKTDSQGLVEGFYRAKRAQTSDTIGTTFVSEFVSRLYREILLREPDSAGLQAWVDRINSGTDVSEVAASFIFSKELTDRKLSNADYTETLYRAILGRASESAGKNAWVGRLNSGMPRGQMFYGFIESVEFAEICQSYGLSVNPIAGIDKFVTRLYTECLGREPDEYGRNAWIDRIKNSGMTGTEVAQGFVFSTEMKNKKLSDTDFIEALYLTLLGRPADEDGKAGWVGQLKNMSRERVFREFARSNEFADICRSLGVER